MTSWTKVPLKTETLTRVPYSILQVQYIVYPSRPTIAVAWVNVEK